MDAGTRIGRYVVEAWVGQGGMATVWRVRDDAGRPWALKVLSLLRDDVRQRFRSEARVQLALHHPNIVLARELLEVDGEPALVLEYVDGTTLDRYLATRRPPTAVRDDLTSQILAGVAHAHAQNLVHRDLKPANVLVIEGPDGRVTAKITDFGLVKELGVAATRSGIALGTPRYMAPEQIQDAKRVDRRADLWSLGTLLYEMYTDHCPFHRDTLLETFTAVLDGAYEDPARFGVPERVRDAIAACLQVDPDRRVPRVADLVRILEGRAPSGLPASRAPSAPPLPATPLRAPDLASAPTVLTASSDPQVFRLPPRVPAAAPVARSGPPAPVRRKRAWLVPWLASSVLALVVVGVVWGATALAVAVWAIGDAAQGPEAPSAPLPPPKARRGR